MRGSEKAAASNRQATGGRRSTQQTYLSSCLFACSMPKTRTTTNQAESNVVVWWRAPLCLELDPYSLRATSYDLLTRWHNISKICVLGMVNGLPWVYIFCIWIDRMWARQRDNESYDSDSKHTLDMLVKLEWPYQLIYHWIQTTLLIQSGWVGEGRKGLYQQITDFTRNPSGNSNSSGLLKLGLQNDFDYITG